MPREPKVDADAVVTALRDGPREFAAPPELADALDVTPQTIRNNHDRIIDDSRIDTTKISRSTVYYLPEDGEPDLAEQSGSSSPPSREFKGADELESESAPPAGSRETAEEPTQAHQSGAIVVFLAVVAAGGLASLLATLPAAWGATPLGTVGLLLSIVGLAALAIQFARTPASSNPTSGDAPASDRSVAGGRGDDDA